MKKWFLISLCLISYVSKTQEIKVFVDTTKIEIGKPINLYIEVKDFQNERIQFPFLKDSISPKLPIISQKIDTLLSNKSKVIRDRITFTSWEQGIHSIQRLPIIIGTDTLYTTNTQIEVVNSIVGTDINDIKDIITKPDTLLDYLLKYWPFIVVVLFLFMILYFIKLFKQKRKEINPSNRLTVEEIALLKIQELEEKNLMETHQAKKHYSELVDILKEYIGHRYQFSAFNFLSNDLVFHLKRNYFVNQENQVILKKIFRAADLAKFAKSQPTIIESKEHNTLAKTFIENNKPKIITDQKNA